METPSTRSTFQTKSDTSLKIFEKTSKMTSKWPQNGSKMEPKVVPKRSRGPSGQRSINWAWFFRFLVAPELQNGGQKSQKNLKNLIQEHFSTPSKNHDFQDTFFAVFSMFWKPQNLGNQAKTLYCMQKSWVGTFWYKSTLFQNNYQKIASQCT